MTPYLNKLLKELGVDGEIVNGRDALHILQLGVEYTTNEDDELNGFFVMNNNKFTPLADELYRKMFDIKEMYSKFNFLNLYEAISEVIQTNSLQSLEEWAKTLLDK